MSSWPWMKQHGVDPMDVDIPLETMEVEEEKSCPNFTFNGSGGGVEGSDNFFSQAHSMSFTGMDKASGTRVARRFSSPKAGSSASPAFPQSAVEGRATPGQRDDSEAMRRVCAFPAQTAEVKAKLTKEELSDFEKTKQHLWKISQGCEEKLKL